MTDIDVNINTVNLNIDTGGININIESTSTITQSISYVDSGSKIYLNGNGGDSYLVYNPLTSMIEIWVGNVKQSEWGASGPSW